MNNVIIAIYGKSQAGKSDTIKRVHQKLMNFPNARFTPLREPNGDILGIVELGELKIGIESQGDPKSDMINSKTIEKLAGHNCKIIVCATRTRGGDSSCCRGGSQRTWF